MLTEAKCFFSIDHNMCIINRYDLLCRNWLHVARISTCLSI